ncbi:MULTISPECIES: hypothetical protein [unclassified Nocardia]|uniref:hypothetical protein n=1 Tax=unclassified Nocardia TaxID=2637762 RepID=UPI001CE3D75C|nr:MULTISPECIES: hypothetical protein [unclassified Nocardia]
MPLVEVTYAPHVPDATLRRLADVLPHIVSTAVECPEEPYDGDLQPGDVELRFRALGPYDRSELDAVIEVRSKYFESRAVNRQERTDLLHDRIAEVVDLDNFGVYLVLPVAAWTQTD